MHIKSTNIRYNNLIHSGNKYTRKGNRRIENLLLALDQVLRILDLV
jgi:hypothetical protein